jgi:hypothetical protein
MPIDASIPLQARNQTTDPGETFGRMVQLKALMGQQQLQDLQTQQLRQGIDNERTLADVYKSAVNPDGTVNRQAVLTGAAQRGLGSKIPSMQEGFAKVDKEQSELDKNRASTKETELKMVKQKLDIAGGMISSLLSIPDVTPDHVVAKVSQLVQQGLIPQEEGAQMVRQLPGNPVALRQFLLQKGMEVVEAGKRIELMTPKVEYKQTGKQMVPVDVNSLTNLNPQTLTMTTTPGEDQSAGVTMRGQNMADNRERTLAAQGVTYQETPDGMVALPSKAAPGTTIKAAPVLAPGSGLQQLQGKGSNLTEDQGKATGWLMQANNAWGNMQKVMGVDSGAASPGLGDAVARIPGGGAVGNYLRSSNRQQFSQAASSLSESLLRAATGAGINNQEAEQKVKELTPQWGDTEANIKQKMDAIPIYIESLKVRAGPGAKKVTGTQPAAATPASPAPGALGSGTGGINFQVDPSIDAILKKHGSR